MSIEHMLALAVSQPPLFVSDWKTPCNISVTYDTKVSPCNTEISRKRSHCASPRTTDRSQRDLDSRHFFCLNDSRHGMRLPRNQTNPIASEISTAGEQP